MDPGKIDARFLRLTDELIARGVTAVDAAKISKEMIFAPKPWYSPDEAAPIIGLVPEVICRALRAGRTFKGARKICGQWRIPASAVLPEDVRH